MCPNIDLLACRAVSWAFKATISAECLALIVLIFASFWPLYRVERFSIFVTLLVKALISASILINLFSISVSNFGNLFISVAILFILSLNPIKVFC